MRPSRSRAVCPAGRLGPVSGLEEYEKVRERVSRNGAVWRFRFRPGTGRRPGPERQLKTKRKRSKRPRWPVGAGPLEIRKALETSPARAVGRGGRAQPPLLSRQPARAAHPARRPADQAEPDGARRAGLAAGASGGRARLPHARSANAAVQGGTAPWHAPPVSSRPDPRTVNEGGGTAAGSADSGPSPASTFLQTRPRVSSAACRLLRTGRPGPGNRLIRVKPVFSMQTRA